MENLKRDSRNLQIWLVLIFLFLSIGIIVLEAVFYNYRVKELKSQIYQELSAVADSKRDRITIWCQNREKLAQSISENPFIRENLLKWVNNPGDQNLKHKFLLWMEQVNKFHDFTNVTIVNSRCEALLSIKDNYAPCDRDMNEAFRSALKSGKATLSDFHIGEDNAIKIDVLSPFIGTGDFRGDKSAFAAIVFEVNPGLVLFPLIESWPTQSRTAETFILRQNGDSVQYLNDLRHRKNTEMSFMLSSSDRYLLAAQGLRGGDGIYEGLDYRSISSLGVFRAIPGTPWYMVSKIDKSEVFESINKLTLILILTAVVFIALAASGTAVLYHSQNSRYYKSLFTAEQKLRQSEQRFNAVVENTQAGYFFFDRDGYLRAMNNAWLEMYGYDKEEVNGHHFSQFQVDGDLEQARKVMGGIMRNDPAFFTGEFSRKQKDGLTGYHTFSAGPVIQNGEIVGVEGFVIDTTEQRKVVESLRMNENLLRQSQRVARIGHYEFYPAKEVWTSSEILDEIFGIDDSFCKDTDGWLSILHPLHHDEISVYLKEHVLKNGNPFNKEYRIIRKSDGAVRWVHGRGDLEFDENRIAVKMFGVIQDITERKSYEAEIDAERERLLVTLRSIGDGVIATDTEGRVLLMNPVAESLTGWSQKDAAGKSLSEVFHIVNEMTGKRCENPVDRVLKEGIIVELANHTKLISRDGRTFILADSGSPIRDNSQSIIGVVLVFRNITEKQQIEENLQQSQRMESLGLLAGGIAHDFNNMLSGMFGYLEMGKYLVDNKGYEELENVLDRALSVFDRARSLTHQLLTFSKGGEPVRKRTDIGSLLNSCISFVSSGSRIKIKTDIAGDLLSCDVDESQIGQVIDNIIINAQQSMPDGGAIVVCASNHRAESEDDAGNRKNYIKVSISDTGIGIPYEYLNKIFHPFFTTKQHGSGLGLATAYSIVKKHKGWIDVKSDMGKGTVFIIFLPANSGVEIPSVSNVTGKSIERVSPVQKRILVMDDEAYIQDVAAMVLSSIGCEVEVASDGDEAVRKFSSAIEERKPFSAMILDLTIPGKKGGKDIVTEIRGKDPDIFLIASSGYSEDPVMARPNEFGFTHSLPKPYRRKEILELLGTIFNS